MSEVPPPPQQPSGFSNYPRAMGPQGGWSPYQRPPGIYFDAIGLAWRLTTANLGTWVGTILIYFVCVFAISIPSSFGITYLVYGTPINTGGFDLSKFILQEVLSLIPSLLTNVIAAGLMFMGVREARCEPIGIGDLFAGFRRFGPVVVGMFLMTLIIYLGCALLVIPGFFAAGALAFVPLLMLDRNMSQIEAIQTSYNSLKSNAFSMFALLFVVGLIATLGGCLCGVGLLFTMPVAVITIGLTYNNYFPPANAGVAQQIGVEPPR